MCVCHCYYGPRARLDSFAIPSRGCRKNVALSACSHDRAERVDELTTLCLQVYVQCICDTDGWRLIDAFLLGSLRALHDGSVSFASQLSENRVSQPLFKWMHGAQIECQQRRVLTTRIQRRGGDAPLWLPRTRGFVFVSFFKSILHVGGQRTCRAARQQRARVVTLRVVGTNGT